MVSSQAFILKLVIALFAALAGLYAVIMLPYCLKGFKTARDKGYRKNFIEYIKESRNAKKFNKKIDRIFGVFLTCGICGAVILLGILKVCTDGPSDAWNGAFAGGLDSSRRFGFLNYIFMTEEKREAALAAAGTISYEVDTAFPNSDGSSSEFSTAALDPRFTGTDSYGLEYTDGVCYKTMRYKNSDLYMVVVTDPTRVFVGVTEYLGSSGMRLTQFCDDYDALCGINAGGFQDPDGAGNGGYPAGITISEGTTYNNSPERAVAGLDASGHMYVGYFEYDQCIDFGLQNVVSFGPILLTNGKIGEQEDLEAGNNPRTAIGQRKDGAIVMVCIDGRQGASAGVSQLDLAKFLKSYGVVEALNLDSGSSTSMCYEGEIVNNPSGGATSSRYLPTAWLVRR